ncbi:hypothetical protein HK104_011070, partial [Borealophlyctis nickersoniae]
MYAIVDSYGHHRVTLFTFQFATSFQDLFRFHKSFMNPNPKARMDMAAFLEHATQKRSYFDNDFVSVSLFLEQIAIKDVNEKEQFLRKIDTSIASFPAAFCKYKILPELIKALEFGGAGARALTPILKLGSKLDQEEFDALVVPIIIKLFASPDRSIRISLCENLGHFIEHLGNKVVTDKIFPNLATGFHDTSAIIREHTLKSVLLIITKLSDKIINNDLLRYLAKLQQDEEPGIRTNTTICLGKISKYLNDTTKKRVLLVAFLRSLNDPFPPSRNAGLLALAATAEYYDAQDVATKIVPALAALTLDTEKTIRVQAFKNIELFVKRLEKFSQMMPDTAAPPPSATKSDPQSGTPPPTSTSGGGEGWAGWALSAVSNKLTAGLMNEATTPPATSNGVPDGLNGTGAAGGGGLKDISASGATSGVVMAASVLTLGGNAPKGDDGWGNNDGWDEEIPFDDNDWAPPTKPKANILSSKRSSFGATGSAPAAPAPSTSN